MQPDPGALYVVASYEEIRLRFGLNGTDAARIKAKRRKWEPEPRNHPGALARIRVPKAEWDAAPTEIATARSRRALPDTADQSHNMKPLEDALAAFREEQQRGAEREAQLRQDLAAAITRGDTMQVEVASLQLRAAVLEAKLEAAEAALAEARRPFWRRWMG